MDLYYDDGGNVNVTFLYYGVVAYANARTLRKWLAKVGEEGVDWLDLCVHRGQVYGTGHFEARPGTKAASVLVEAKERYDRYPILDEFDYAEVELEEAQDLWECLALWERIRVCHKAGISVFAARRNEVPVDAVPHMYLPV